MVGLCAFAAALAVACDKVPLLAPPESTITLSAASTVVQANGTTEIHAVLIEPSGTPVHNGTTVLFTTNLGTLLPVEAQTHNGVATVQFLGNGQSGKATIKAISGGTASEVLELSVGAGAAGRVSVTANPASVPAAGGTTTISAIVLDASGNPLFGVPVSFVTTAGTFSSVIVNTDTSGTARTTLTTNQAASVTAAAGSTTSAPVSITVAAVPVRPTVSITVSATPTEGGVTTFSLTVTPPATGGSPIQAVTVDYGDESSDNLGSVSGPISVQHVYEDSGSYRPTVTVVDSAGSSVTASTVIFVQPLLVSINVGTPNPLTPTTMTFTANVSPSGTSIASYTWRFDDDTPLTPGTAEMTHKYSKPGRYTVRVVVRTSTGHTSTGTTTITIQ